MDTWVSRMAQSVAFCNWPRNVQSLLRADLVGGMARGESPD